ncbi:aminotransferase class I/II-fold pyridoxal phosphate-dependent enzyme, partial [Citrobacter sp. AAK_AS5]
ALAGERGGYVAVNPAMPEAGKLVAGVILTNRILGFVNAPALMQRLVAGLQNVSVNIGAYREKRDLLYDNLTGMGFRMIKPDGAFYLFPKSPIPDDIKFVKLALQHHILL